MSNDILCSEGSIVHSLTTHRGTCVKMIQRPDRRITCYMDGEIQSCESDEMFYHEALVQPAIFCVSNPKRVLIVGGGEGATLREVLKCHTVEKVDMIDWDKDVIHLFQTKYPQWAKGAWTDSRVTIRTEDIMEVIKESQHRVYDVIIVDLFDPTEETINQLKDILIVLSNWVVQDGAMAVYAGMNSSLIPTHEWFKKNIQIHEKMTHYQIPIPSFEGNSLFLLFHTVTTE